MKRTSASDFTSASPQRVETGDKARTAISAAFADLFASTRCVIFDFDGPLCDLFAPPRRFTRRRTIRMTRHLRKILSGQGRPTPALTRRNDPHELFRSALDALGPDMSCTVQRLRRALHRLEIEAARTAVTTPSSEHLLMRLHQQGIGLAIASNNCEHAINSYLRRSGLAHHFEDSVIGRPDDHRLMKPDPYVVEHAMLSIGAEAEECMMIGDSLADVAAARAAGIRICAYAPDKRKRRRLLAAGATFAIASLRDLHEAMDLATNRDPSSCTSRSA